MPKNADFAIKREKLQMRIIMFADFTPAKIFIYTM